MENINQPRSRILENIPVDVMKLLYYNALSMEIDDTNTKAEVIRDILSNYKFRQLGPGTNRAAFQKNGYVFKIGLDRRGLVDNFSEFKRSPEVPHLCSKTYETNFLVAVAEYVNLMDYQTFELNKDGIREVLHQLSQDYIFGDIGIAPRNFENWGYRDNGDIVCLDYAYLYPKAGNEEVLKCPLCNGGLMFDQNYVNFICEDCRAKFKHIDIRRRMKTDLENAENEAISSLYGLKAPNLTKLNEEIGPMLSEYRRLVKIYTKD